MTLGRALILSVALVAIGGCRKKPLPSERYTQAHEMFRKLYAAQLDDAYADPAIAQVEELLRQVPDDSSDFADAQALSRRTREGRSRLQEAEAIRRAASAQAMASAPYERMQVRAAQPPEATPPVEDAGSNQPWAHMPLSEFTRRFSGCFKSSDRINVLGQGMHDSWELKDIANCRDRHPGFDQLLVLTNGTEVAMNIAKSLIEYRLPDGGTPTQPAKTASSSAR
jgi:hypothetical protein